MSDIIKKDTELEPQDDFDDDDDFAEEDDDWATDPKEMGFLDHLEELRWTLIKPLAVFAIGFVLAVVFIKDVQDVLMYPLAQNSSAEEMAVFEGLATRNPTGVFSAILQMGLLIGVAVSSPFFVYYISKFLAPALTKREKLLLLPGSLSALFLFMLGCSFAFFLLLPKAIEVTMQFNYMLGFQIIWAPDSYFGFITWIVLGMGVSFQFPLVAVVLVYLDIVTVEKLRSMRRLLIVIFFIASAILTPPDPVTQIMMAVPMIALYEIALVVASTLVGRRRRAELKAEAE